MRNTKAAQTAAALTAGSAERMIEERGAKIDGLTAEVSRSLIQASGEEDTLFAQKLMDALDHLTTDEADYTDRESGEVLTTNRRRFWKEVLMGGLVQKVDYLLERQNKRCADADARVARVERGKTADVDGSEIARAEAWAEAETDKLLALANVRREFARSYLEHVGQAYVSFTDRPATPARSNAETRAAARKQALEALTKG